MVNIYLKPKKEESLLRFHPWVFSGAIGRMDGQPVEGDWVRVLDHEGRFLGAGHYQVGSIAVRILSFSDCEADRSWWERRIGRAFRLRQTLGLVRPGENDTFRLVHGEGDQLPGLVVDVYGETAVMQAHSVGMHQERQLIAETVQAVVPGVRHIYYKSESTLPYKAPIDPQDGYLIGGPADGEHLALESGLRFQVDWLRGQKTGFFIDQRDNRSLLEHYAPGRSVLNMFCYTGGFSVYALRGGAERVHSVDSSAKAIELTNRNVALNFPGDTRHEAYAEDAFKFLQNNREEYDLIILDPPAFAKHRDAVRNALKGYQRLNAKAIRQIRSGGLLFTFSCSQAVSREQFRLAVFSAAAETGREVRILHQLTQPADHPVNIYHPEGEYLKGLVLWVE